MNDQEQIGVSISEMGENEPKEEREMKTKKKKNKKKNDNINLSLPNENPDIENVVPEGHEYDFLNSEPKIDAAEEYWNNYKQNKFESAIAFSVWNWSAPWIGLMVATGSGSVVIGSVLTISMLLASFSFYLSHMKNV